jgi:hypothetical protein
MAVVHITFTHLVQDSQEYGSTDEHMVSRAFFDMQLDGRKYKDLSVAIKQVVGSTFETSPLEVSEPIGYEGPFNYDAFRKAVEQYYRDLVGSRGALMHLSEGCTNVRMQNNHFSLKKDVEFEVSIDNPAW